MGSARPTPGPVQSLRWMNNNEELRLWCMAAVCVAVNNWAHSDFTQYDTSRMSCSQGTQAASHLITPQILMRCGSRQRMLQSDGARARVVVDRSGGRREDSGNSGNSASSASGTSRSHLLANGQNPPDGIETLQDATPHAVWRCRLEASHRCTVVSPLFPQTPIGSIVAPALCSTASEQQQPGNTTTVTCSWCCLVLSCSRRRIDARNFLCSYYNGTIQLQLDFVSLKRS